MASTKDNYQVSTATVHMIREEKIMNGPRAGEIITIEANLPCGRGYLKGNAGAIDWINLGVGWRSYDEYMAAKNTEQAAAKREAATTKGAK